MRIARKKGINRYCWSSLTPVLESMKDPAVYSDSVCIYGAFDASETLNYVRAVKRVYREYNSLDLLFRASEKVVLNDR
jgi:hypothetical protein